MSRLTVPILDESLETAIRNAVIMFTKKTEWKSLGMNALREQGAALLFTGPPGTGKTITARYLCRTLKYTMHEMDFGDIGSDTPGQLARNIKKLFTQAVVPDIRGNPSFVFLDECDTLLVSRARLGHSSMWMLEPINAMLRAIGEYPGLVVMATNQKPDFLDYALERRLLGSFEFNKPSFDTVSKLWRAKWPKKLPVKLDNGDVDALALYGGTGADIERILIQWVSDTLRKESNFIIDELFETTRKFHNERINS